MVSTIGFIVFALIIVLLLVFRISPVPVFAVIPLLGALVLGFGFAEIGEMVEEGILQVMSVGSMFIFAMLYFGIMTDAGLFDPLTSRMKKMAGNNVVLIVFATSVIALMAHLDGTGASTFLVTIPALLPIYKKMNMSPLLLLLVVVMSAGVMNLLPWGGPMARVAVTLDIDPNEFWVPIIPIMIVGIISTLLISLYLGFREKKRLGKLGIRNDSVAAALEEEEVPESPAKNTELLRPKLWWFNLLLTLITIAILIATSISYSAVFMVMFSIAVVVNYPTGKMQRERIKAHAAEAFNLVCVLLAAGAFLGIINTTGMVEEMTLSLISVIPEFLTPYLHVIVGIFSVPLISIIPPDAYHFGFTQLLVEVGGEYGVPATSVAYSAVVGATVGGYVSPLIAATYLAIGLGNQDLPSHVKYSLPWLWLMGIILFVASVLFGLVTF